MSDQLALFSAGTAEPVAGDLAGLLCGAGQVVRREGTARVSVVVDDAWRAGALRVEFAARGLGEEVRALASTGWSGSRAVSVRTDFRAALLPLALAWSGAGSGKRVPDGYVLEPLHVRLWALAGLRPWEGGYALALGEHDERCWEAVGAALAHAGIAGALVGPRGGGPAYRISQHRRQRRLAELVGEPPPGAPPGAWPG